MDNKTHKLDGAKLAVINSRLEGAARKMANTLLRTGRSGVLNRARDFSCCTVSADCDLVAAAESLPIHVLSGPDIMARHMKLYHPELRAGDAFLNNSPYHGCSHAAAPNNDCWMTIGHVGNAGMCYQDSIELVELYHPMRVRARRFIPNSEDAGRYKGAPGVQVEFGPIGADMEIGYMRDGAVNAPLDARGGLAGLASDQYVEHSNGKRTPLPGCAQEVLRDGETLVSISCGGGGYGEPKDRAIEAVAKDVRDGWITNERASSVYGVALKSDLSVDKQATAKLRA